MHSIIAALTTLGLSTADAVILAALHPTRDHHYLATLARAIVTGLPLGRTVADMAVLADPAYNLDAASVAILLSAPPTGLPAAFNRANIVTLLAHVGGLNAHQMVQLVNCLHPSLNVADTLGLLNPLQADGLDGLQIYLLVQHLNASGQTGGQIEALIRSLRGHLRVVAPPNPLARFVTDIPALAVPAPPPPYPPHLLPGQKVLSAPEILAHLTHTLAAGRAATTIAHTYATGQDFTTRTIDQLWDDCDVMTNGTTLTDINTGVAEPPTQKKIRQKLALKELMRRHSARVELIQQIFSHQEGQVPRAVLSPRVEDALGAALGAHTVARHVLATPGPIQTEQDLAMRVCRHIPSSCPNQGGVFANLTAAQNAMQAAITQMFNDGNWPAWRRKLAIGATINQDVAIAGVMGTVLAKPPAPPAVFPGVKYLAVDMPPYIQPGHGVGVRPVFPSDPNFVRNMARYETSPGSGLYQAPWGGMLPTALEPANPLTNRVPITGVHLRIISANNAPGGWFIHSAWPY